MSFHIFITKEQFKLFHDFFTYLLPPYINKLSFESLFVEIGWDFFVIFDSAHITSKKAFS